MSEECGIIILGNTGSGKSFLADILLGEDVFHHECSSRSITRLTAYHELQVGKIKYAIFDIPGLIEADQDLVEVNKMEIETAFDLRPNSIVLFVFNGGSGGRIRDEDMIAFKAINDAYKFKKESLILILNDLPSSRPSRYEGETTFRLAQLTGLNDVDLLAITYRDYTFYGPARSVNTCFLNRIQHSDSQQREQLRSQLLDVIIKCKPHIYTKQKEIQLHIDEINQLKQLFIQQQNEFDSKVSELRHQIAERQSEFDQLRNQPPREIHHYHEKIIERHTKSGGGCIIS
jgi:hypothetical protein